VVFEENLVAVPQLTVPEPDVEVTVLVRQGKTWYQQGDDTASNGVPLQEADTLAARFLRGF
jgi:hypothetical protein